LTLNTLLPLSYHCWYYSNVACI